VVVAAAHWSALSSAGWEGLGKKQDRAQHRENHCSAVGKLVFVLALCTAHIKQFCQQFSNEPFVVTLAGYVQNKLS